MTENATIGALGEKIATKHLRQKGFLIRELNWRCGRYEIDIIAQKWDTVHFVEVKTRKAGGWSSPEDAITPTKITSLRRAATAYMASKGIREEIEFDLLAIEMEGESPTEIRFVKNIL